MKSTSIQVFIATIVALGVVTGASSVKANKLSYSRNLVPISNLMRTKDVSKANDEVEIRSIHTTPNKNFTISLESKAEAEGVWESRSHRRQRSSICQ